MSALPATEERPKPGPSARSWPLPPEEGWAAGDLDRITDLPPHTELIDGRLVFVGPQKLFHMLVLRVLERSLDRAAPDGLFICREFTVAIGEKSRPEPDLMAVRAESAGDLDQSSFPPEAVELAVEVVSPDSEARDRFRKPQLYSGAGIPHFWRVEKEDGAAVVYVYERDPATGEYVATGIHRGTLKLTVPFDIEVDLTEIERM